MNIRVPTIMEVDDLYQIELENYGPKESTEKETFKELVEYPEDFPDYTLKVLVDKNVVGFYCTIEELRKVELVDIAVSKNSHKQGYGRILLEDCLNANQKLSIGLIVREDNLPAIGLYKKFDFKQVEVLKDYYDDCSGIRFKKLPSQTLDK